MTKMQFKAYVCSAAMTLALIGAAQGADTLYPVEHDGQWGFMNKQGVLSIQPSFESVGTFSEDRARVKADGKWGFVNATGDVVIKTEFR
jgi:hypothetical protein